MIKRNILTFILCFTIFKGLSGSSYPDTISFVRPLDQISIVEYNSGFGTSGKCNVNINCPEGTDWQLEKKSVVRIFAHKGEYAEWGTGILLNNTNNDYRHLVLTADHLLWLGNKYIPDSLHREFRFYFNYESATCKNPTSEDDVPQQVLTGMKLLAHDRGLDFALFELLDTIPYQFDPYFSGWSLYPDSVLPGVAIHHPNGDIKKISHVKSLTIGSNTIWVKFKETENGFGVTEKGSSGSPLFNPHKKLIGNLISGSTSCQFKEGTDKYGNFYYNMFTHQDDSTRSLAYWLNLSGKNILSLKGISYPELDEDLNPSLVELKLYPNPVTNGNINIKTSFSGDLHITLHDYMGKLYLNRKLNVMASIELPVALENIKSGIYIMRLRYGNAQFTRKIIIFNEYW
ncbi:MAG: T9SS type A sorting domain-containing protein [Bacteroidales bacterium]